MDYLNTVKQFIKTYNLDFAMFGLRLALASIFIVHGTIMLGTARETMSMFTTLGLDPFVGIVVALLETISGVLVLFGLLVRTSALTQTILSIGMIYFVHGKHGFLLQNSGYEYVLLIMATSLTVGLLGPGKISLSQYLVKK